MTLTDDEIRKLARARVDFRRHLATYVVVNVFFAALWWFTSGRDSYYWPIWVHLGWGIGLAFNAWGAYGGGTDTVAREEARLREKYGRPPASPP